MKKMKKIILTIAALIFTLNISAQLDRSIMPTGGPSPKIKLDKPKEFKIKNGIRVLVVENHKLPRINYSLRFDRKPIVEGEKAGVISKKIEGNPLNEEKAEPEVKEEIPTKKN